VEHKGKLVIASHLGRPKGKVVDIFSLKPVAVRLGELMGKDVDIAPDCVGEEVKKMVSDLKNEDVLLLENLRFHKKEQENDKDFGKALSKLCDIYVNDAFAVSHRENASVHAITEFVKVKCAGFLLLKELAYFDKAMANPERPLVAVVGGAKVSSKLGALENMLDKVDKLIIGGAMANTFLKALGHDLGRSKIEEDLVDKASEIIKRSSWQNIKLYLPVDVVAADKIDIKADIKNVTIQEIPYEWMALDVGPATSLLFAEALNDAGTIIWNGPMGIFEIEPFSKGTMSMADSVASSSALTIVGGGDTDVAIHRSGKAAKVTYISTGGGAFLSLLEGKKLPAVEVL
jgi:phosphoglycerate kinase